MRTSRIFKISLLTIGSLVLTLWLLSGSFNMAKLPTARAVAGVYTVDETVDNTTDTACTGASNDCSLRGAILTANANPGSTIILPAGVYTLTLTGADEDAGLTGDLDISATVTISGAGSSTTIIQGAPGWNDRLLDVHLGTMQLNGVTLRYGNVTGNGGALLVGNSARVTIDSSALVTNSASISGGAVESKGPLTVTNSSLVRNMAISYGGGLHNLAALVISNTSLVTNSAFHGGAIMNDAQLWVINSHILSNTVGGQGGGIYNDSSAALNMSGSWLTGNRANDGAGVLVNGPTSISGTLFTHNSATHNGGAINNYTSNGTLMMTNTQLISNTAISGGGGLYIDLSAAWASLYASQVLSNTAGSGGGLYNYRALTLTLSTVAGNRGGNGGGVLNYGTLLIDSSTVARNASTSDGAGLYSNGSAIISNSQFISNVISSTIGSGGGIAVYGTDSVLTMTHSSIANNHAATGGGIDLLYGNMWIDHSSIYNNTVSGEGAGLYDYNGWLTMTNSTLSDNSSNGNGGGLGLDQHDAAYTVMLQNDTIVNNLADSDNDGAGDGGGISQTNNISVTLINTLLANNIDRGGQAPDCAGSIISLGYNLIRATTGCTLTGILTGVITNTNPLIGPLQDNGGSTWTHALIKGSPALDAGDPDLANCPSTDQRDVARPIGSWCDIGAYEGYVNVVYLPLTLKSF